MSFEIVKGDYGRGYAGVVKDINYSDCTGKIYVWNKARTAKIIDGKDCIVTYVSPDTHITFVPALNDFNIDAGTYYGMFVFLKSGVLEHTLEFVWQVMEKEPVVA